MSGSRMLSAGGRLEGGNVGQLRQRRLFGGAPRHHCLPVPLRADRVSFSCRWTVDERSRRLARSTRHPCGPPQKTIRRGRLSCARAWASSSVCAEDIAAMLYGGGRQPINIGDDRACRGTRAVNGVGARAVASRSSVNRSFRDELRPSRTPFTRRIPGAGRGLSRPAQRCSRSDRDTTQGGGPTAYDGIWTLAAFDDRISCDEFGAVGDSGRGPPRR